MAGKILDGSSHNNDPILAKAYCRGRLASVVGGLTNTHTVGTPEWYAWESGASTRAHVPAGTVDNCADPVPDSVLVPNVVGMLASDANALLLDHGLVVGTIGATGVITAQNPAAYTSVALGTTVTYSADVTTLIKISGKTGVVTDLNNGNMSNARASGEVFITQSGIAVSSKANEIIFDKARRNQNLFTKSQAHLSYWTSTIPGTRTMTLNSNFGTDPYGYPTTQFVFSAGTGTPQRYVNYTTTSVIGDYYIFSFTINRSPDNNISYTGATAATKPYLVSRQIGNGWWECYRIFNMTTANGVIGAAVQSPIEDTFEVGMLRLEKIQDLRSLTPKEVLTMGVLAVPYYYAGVDGVKYYSNNNPTKLIYGWGDSLTLGTGGSESYLNKVYNNPAISSYCVPKGVGGETSTQILTRFNAQADNSLPFNVIWAGRNNYSDPTTVKADIATMVAASPNYLVVSVLNGDYSAEWQGGANYNVIMQLNSDLSTLYGSRYIDVRILVVAGYNPLNSQDIIDHGHDTTPSTLRYDQVHLNDAGYQIVADAITSKINSIESTYNSTVYTPLLLYSNAQTNLALNPRDFTQAAWVKTNVTAAFTSTGMGSDKLSCSRLTATGANGTVLQTLTSVSSIRSTGVFIKRITGTGTISLTQDNGVTWTPVTITSSWPTKSFVLPAVTSANPVFGIQISTSGDAIDVDYFNHVLNTSIYMPSVAARTRSDYRLPLSVPTNFSQTNGIALLKVYPKFPNSATAKSLVCTNATTDFIFDNGSGEIGLFDGTNTATTSGLTGWTGTDTIYISACWSTNLMSIHASKDNGATWKISANTTYDGAFSIGANLLLCNLNTDTYLIELVNINSTIMTLANAQTWAKTISNFV